MKSYPIYTVYLPSSAILENGPVEVERPTKEAINSFEDYLEPLELAYWKDLPDEVRIDVMLARNPFDQFRDYLEGRKGFVRPEKLKTVTWENIENEVKKHLQVIGTSPRFILLDSKSFQIFQKECVSLRQYESSEEPKPRLTQLNLRVAPWGVKIYEVVTNEFLFEVVS